MVFRCHDVRRIHLHAGWFFLLNSGVVVIQSECAGWHHPRLGQDVRIFYGRLIVEPNARAPQALGHVPLRGRQPSVDAQPDVAVEIDRVDDERVSFPGANGISHVGRTQSIAHF